MNFMTQDEWLQNVRRLQLEMRRVPTDPEDPYTHFACFSGGYLWGWVCIEDDEGVLAESIADARSMKNPHSYHYFHEYHGKRWDD